MTFIEKIFLKVYHHFFDIKMMIRKLENVDIEITKTCNLQCKHCYMNSKTGKVSGELTKNDWFRFFDNLKKNYSNKVIINISGGEPLIKEDIFEILEYAKKLGFKITLVTNGILLNKKIIQKLDKILHSIGISLDGFEREHNFFRGDNCFSKIVENIRLLKKESNIKIGIKTTLFKRNCDVKYLEKFYKFILDLDVDLWHFFPMESIGRGKENKQEIMTLEQYEKVCDFVDNIKQKNNKLDILFQEQTNNFIKTRDFYKIKRCMAGITFMTILSNGDVVKCLHSDNPANPETYGNILKDDLKNIWEEKLEKSIKNKNNFCIKPYFLTKMKEKYG